MNFEKLWSNYNPKTYQQNNRCLSVNTILAGKYLVGPVLGQGGFGITYQGYDLNMETRIAIKEYFPVELVSRDTTTVHGDHVLSLSGEKSITYKQGLKKYVEEAQKVSQFSEIAGVVSVKDFFYENETAYIVMEYIEGESLKDYLKRKGGRLSEEETLFIMKPVIEALIKIHQAGIIHRDISPDNIMLTFDASKDNSVPEKIKSIKLIDFGAARMTAKNDQKSLTIILKHGYAPEEQYRTHGEQGSWTDVYAICATMYRMLTGETPVPAMDRMFQDNLKSLDSFGIKISKNTQNALIKGLAVKKVDRFQTMEDLLATFYEGKRIASSKKHNRIPSIIGFMAAILIAGVVIVVGISYFSKKSTAPVNLSEEMIQDNILTEDTSMENAANESIEMVMNAEEEVIGETIAYPHPQTAISKGNGHVLIRMNDGTVKTMGDNTYGQCKVEEWTDIVAVAAGSRHSLGLRSDGKVFATGSDNDGECAVDTWSNVVQIAATNNASFGLTKDGTILAVGDNEDGMLEKVSQWRDIVAIETGQINWAGIFGVDSSGNVHYAGIEAIPEISGWEGVTHLSYRSFSLIGLKEDGSILKAQLSDDSELYNEVETWTDMKQISTELPCMGVKKDGTIILQKEQNIGDNYKIQEGVANWSDLEAVSSICSVDRIYIIGLQKDGTILEYIQAYGNADLESMNNLAWIDTWEASDFTNLIAGTKDGKLLTYGLEYFRMDELAALNNTHDFSATNVQDVVGGYSCSTLQMTDGRLYDYLDHEYFADSVKQAIMWYGGGYMILKEDGTIKLPEWDYESIFADEYTDMCKEAVSVAENWTNVIQIAGKDICLYGLHEDGTISSTFAENEWQDIICIDANDRNELVGIHKDGAGVLLESSQVAESYNFSQIETWSDLKDIEISESHIAGLKNDGTVVAIGSNHVGQCDVEDWTDIVYMTTGKHCTLGITAGGELKMAGSLY